MRLRASSPAWAVVVVALGLAARAGAADEADVAGRIATQEASVRVRSTPGSQPATEVTLQLAPDVRVVDRTPGARPRAVGTGPVSAGDTFSDEITLFLSDFRLARPAAIEVGDDLVTAVRLFPEGTGTTVAVFVRQPVSYTVSQPSSLGEVVLALRARTRPAAPAAGARRPAVFGTGGTGEVAVDADSLSYDQASDTLTAQGSVSLSRGGVTVRADEVRYTRGTGVAEAKGHVVVIDPSGTIEGDAATIDLDDETGSVDQANAQLTASGYSLQAGRLEKGLGATYHVDDGVFTTCRCGGLEKPSWSIGGRRTDIDLKGLGVARGATFRVKDVPVLWLPILPFPANNDRQSGFLMPRLGYSNRRGFQYEQPFFWAIDKSQDLTLATDVETSARLGLIGEYRYILSRESRGDFTAAYYNEQIRGDQSEGVLPPNGGLAEPPENRFAVIGHHISAAPWKSKFYLDVFAVSDDTFLLEINNFTNTVDADVQVRTTRFTRSRTGVVKTWSGGYALVDATYYQDLADPSDQQEDVLQRLPQARIEHRVPLFDGRVVARMAAEGVDFQRSPIDATQEVQSGDKGYSGLRADVFPELFVPFQLGRVLQGSLTGRLRETAYHLTNDSQFGLFAPGDCVRGPVSATNRALGVFCLPNQGSGVRPFEVVAGQASLFQRLGDQPHQDRNRTRELAEVRGRVGSEISRVYRFDHWGLTALRHSIEPELRYLYVPQNDSERIEVRGPALKFDNYPVISQSTSIARGYLFDEVDAINHRSFFAYGVTTRLLGRVGALSPAEQELEDESEETEEATETIGPELPGALTPTPLAPARELLRLSLLAGYDVSRKLVDDSHFSDVDMGLRLTPVDEFGMAYDATWSFERNEIVGQSLGVVLREPWWQPKPENPFQGPSTIGLTYTQIRRSSAGVEGLPLSAGFTTEGAEDVNGIVRVRLGDFLNFTFVARYDLDGGVFARVFDRNGVETSELVNFGPGFLERDYLLRVISRCNCWAVDFGVADKSNPDERLFRVQVTLLGLGSFGQGTGDNFIGLTGLQTLGLRRPTALGGGRW